jgi:Asp-tRNA(Asn)/Glu-tRNA(Gln) amidotransferase A subunit family amidase
MGSSLMLHHWIMSGYFTRSVEDAALALEVLAGRDDKE